MPEAVMIRQWPVVWHFLGHVCLVLCGRVQPSFEQDESRHVSRCVGAGKDPMIYGFNLIRSEFRNVEIVERHNGRRSWMHCGSVPGRR